MMNVEAAETAMRGLIAELTPVLPSQELENVVEYVDAGEWGLAYEILCEQLYEHRVTVADDTMLTLRELGVFGHFDPSTWNIL